MKECKDTTVFHKATEADIEKMEPFYRAIAILEQMIAMTKTNQETIATTDLKGNPEGMECEKPAPVDMTPEVALDQEVPVENAAGMPVGEPKKRRRGGRNLAAVRRQKKKNRVLDARCRGKEQGQAQRKNGCLKNLVAARRGATCRAVMAR
jgi:hypothetical protein